MTPQHEILDLTVRRGSLAVRLTGSTGWANTFVSWNEILAVNAIPFAKAFIAAAPDRMIWGTDWPHTGWRKQRMMNDAELVELLYRYVDKDDDLLRRILVINPARLHGFED